MTPTQPTCPAIEQALDFLVAWCLAHPEVVPEPKPATLEDAA